MLRNIITAFFTRTSVALLMLINLVIVSRYLGSAVLGELSLFVLNIAVIHAVAEVYSGSALVYFIPRLALRKLYISGLLWILCFCCLISILLLMFHVGNDALWVHLLCISFISAVNAFHNVIIIAKEHARTYHFMVFLQPALMVLALAISVFIFGLKSVYACILSLYISHLVAFSISSLFVFGFLSKSNEGIFFNPIAIVRNGFVNQMGNLAHILSNRFNFYIIGALSISMAGVYASATSLIESVWIISISISPLILTHIANRKDYLNNSRITFLLARLSFLLSLICVIVLFFIPAGFFTALLGKDFSQAKTIMLYLSPGVLCISFSSIISHYYSGKGQQRILLFANSAGLVVTLLTSYYFVSLFGIIGACYAASLAYVMQSLVLTVSFMRENNLKASQFFSFTSELSLLRSGE